MRIGLVLEGGAMRGLFTAGALDVFMENEVSSEFLPEPFSDATSNQDRSVVCCGIIKSIAGTGGTARGARSC